MARSRSNDLFSQLRSQGLRKRVAKALSELESGRKSAGGRAEALARQAIKDLRSAAAEIEKRIGTTSSRSAGAKKAAATRKRAAAKRSAAAKKGAAKRKSTGRKTTSRKTTGRKTARKSSARKR